MATYNNVQEYKPEAETIAAYLEQVEIFFQANDIAAYIAGACVFQRRVRKDILLASGPDSTEKVARHNVGSLVQDMKSHFYIAKTCGAILLSLEKSERNRSSQSQNTLLNYAK